MPKTIYRLKSDKTKSVKVEDYIGNHAQRIVDFVTYGGERLEASQLFTIHILGNVDFQEAYKNLSRASTKRKKPNLSSLQDEVYIRACMLLNDNYLQGKKVEDINSGLQKVIEEISR